MSYEMIGKLIAKFDIVQRTETFKTREFVIEKSEDKNIDGPDRASTNIDIETKKNSCELLSYTILPLYKALGYKDYVDSNEVSLGDRWKLQIR